MDILAHGLWVALGVAARQRRRPVTRRVAIATVAMAAAPDLAQLLPLLGVAAFGDAGWGALWAYATAQPGLEPVLPPRVTWLAHHLHCALHSAVVAAVVSALAAWRARAWVLPLLGWWSHIAIDVFTHSATFYPSPVLYPLTQRGFDGIAWNEPWFMAVNYAALAAAASWLWFTQPSRGRAAATL
jgi:hypothetical protein